MKVTVMDAWPSVHPSNTERAYCLLTSNRATSGYSDDSAIVTASPMTGILTHLRPGLDQPVVLGAMHVGQHVQRHYLLAPNTGSQALMLISLGTKHGT